MTPRRTLLTLITSDEHEAVAIDHQLDLRSDASRMAATLAMPSSTRRSF
jgi:hypothetical protein